VKPLLMTIVASLLWVGPAQAQTCVGTVSFATAPLQAGGDLAFGSQSRTFTGGVTRGSEKFFVRGAASFMSISGLNNGAKGILGSFGTELRVGPTSTIFVCPMVTVVKMWGPNPFLTGSGGFSSLVLSFGGSGGFEVRNVGTTRVVPTFGLSFNHLRQSLNGIPGRSGNGITKGDTFLNLQLGVGFIFNERMSLVPSLFVPIGFTEGETVFSVLFGIKVR
jgi:hypothetical protein